MRLYEGMFILNDARCAEDYNGTVSAVHDILKEFGAQIVDSRKWDERKLAYPIRRQRRGVYVLIHFNAPPESITPINRRLELTNDIVLRALILVDEDGVTLGDEKEAEETAREERKERAEQIEQERQEKAEARAAEARAAEAAAENESETGDDQPDEADDDDDDDEDED